YVAWLIPPAGPKEVQVVDLGNTETIDTAVSAVRKTLAAAARSIQQRGEVDAEREMLAAMRPLAEMVLKPIVARIGDAKQLILSADGALWLVPWAALPLADGKYAVEKYDIRYVVSGRNLVERKEEKRKIATGESLILADPDYDLPPAV